MKNLFEQETVDEVITRLDELQPTSQRQWEDGGGADDGALLHNNGHRVRTAQSTAYLYRQVNRSVFQVDLHER